MSVYPAASPEYFSHGAAEDLGVTTKKQKPELNLRTPVMLMCVGELKTLAKR